MHHGLTFTLLCVPFLFFKGKGGRASLWLTIMFIMVIILFFIVTGLIAEGFLYYILQFYITLCNGWNRGIMAATLSIIDSWSTHEMRFSSTGSYYTCTKENLGILSRDSFHTRHDITLQDVPYFLNIR